MRSDLRRPGAAHDGAPHARVVDRLTVHGPPLSFRALAERAIPRDARYVVLDLDRTVHLGRNIGETVGWELCAQAAYGAEHVARVGPARGPGRLWLEPSRPLALARYLVLGARLWAYPGLFYLVWGKLAAAPGSHRRRAYRLFGPEPVREVQSVPQTALLQQLAALPLETVHALARSVWRRHEPDMIFDREDLAWLRARCPRARIVLCSASPAAVLHVAAAELEVDAFVGTEVDVEEGRLSTPISPKGLMVPGRPHRLSPPSRYRINSSYGKIRHLLERFPDLLDEGVVTVGISDNGYGEDRCFAEHFTHVVDVNSTSPFPPIVTLRSPLREVHSAAVLTRLEQERRAAGDPAWVDPRRAKAPVRAPRAFDHAELEAMLGPVLAEVEAHARRFADHARRVAPSREEAERRAREVEELIEAAVARYNVAESPERADAWRTVRGALTRLGDLRRALARIEEPVSEAAYELTRLLEASRRMLEGGTPAPG